MDFAQPVEAVVPGAQGRVLAVLARTSAELSVRAIARLSGVSVAQVSRILPTLVQLGLVHRREVPPSLLFRLVPEHVASQAIRALSDARQTVLDELGRTAELLGARSVVVFGSLARGDASAESDVDVVVVRPDEIGDDDAVWGAALERWRERVQRLTGNRVEIVEVAEAEVPRLGRSRRSFWNDVVRDGVVVAGMPFTALRDSRSA